MTMRGSIERFQGPTLSYTDINRQVLEQYPVTPGTDLLELLNRSDEDLRTRFKALFAETQRGNAGWIEDRFTTFRKESGEWSIDGFVVDAEGRVVISPWSTYSHFSNGHYPTLTIDDLLKRMQQENRLLIPISPVNDTALFWFFSDEGKILPIVEEATHGIASISEYPINAAVAAKMPDMVRLAWVQRDKSGPARFGQVGVAVGGLGFWENNNPANEHDRYLRRVYATSRQTRSLFGGEGIVVSSRTRGQVIVRGGLPMDEKSYGLRVLRTDPALARLDFIAASLVASHHYKPEVPFVLRYKIYRTWGGEIPQHGLSHTS